VEPLPVRAATDRRLPPVAARARPRTRAPAALVGGAGARQRGPGERANALLKAWKILRKIRSSPSRTTVAVNAVQDLILAS
jgi:hypothetical protein